MPHPVLDAIQQQRRRLFTTERQTAARLVDAYGRAYQRMDAQIAALQQSLATTGQLTRAQATQNAALRALRAQVVDEIERFATYADTEIAQAARARLALGITDSRALVNAYVTTTSGARELQAVWVGLNADAVETMIGFLGADSPLHQTLVGRLGEAVATQFEDAMIDAMIAGKGPRVTTALIRRELGTGLTWTLNTTQTAQVYAYREATRASYIANADVVDGWTWYASLDGRQCMSCTAQHGRQFPVTARLNDHHRGRCVQLPNVSFAPKVAVTPGVDWFNGLTERQQIKQMGPAKYNAWRAGEFDLMDLSKPTNNDIYGEMLVEASLKGLLGDRAKDYYK